MLKTRNKYTILAEKSIWKNYLKDQEFDGLMTFIRNSGKLVIKVRNGRNQLVIFFNYRLCYLFLLSLMMSLVARNVGAEKNFIIGMLNIRVMLLDSGGYYE